MNFIKQLIAEFYMWLDDPLNHGGLWEDVIIIILIIITLCIAAVCWVI